LDAAEELFRRKGFRQVSVAAIAHLAGVATRTIYARFGNKQGLLEHLIERCRGNGDELALTVREVQRAPEAALRFLAGRVLSRELSPTMEMLQADALAARLGLTGACFRNLYAGAWRDALLSVFRTSRWCLGMAPVDDPALLADVFVGCVIREYAGAEPGADKHSRPSTLDERAERVLRHFLAMASCEPATRGTDSSTTV
jgi:AcrR family transcriptional regulator